MLVLAGCPAVRTAIHGVVTCDAERIPGARVYIRNLAGKDYEASTASDGTYAIKTTDLKKDKTYTFVIGVHRAIKDGSDVTFEFEGSVNGGETRYIGFRACPEGLKERRLTGKERWG
jgi:hypothetical protein